MINGSSMAVMAVREVFTSFFFVKGGGTFQHFFQGAALFPHLDHLGGQKGKGPVLFQGPAQFSSLFHLGLGLGDNFGKYPVADDAFGNVQGR